MRLATLAVAAGIFTGAFAQNPVEIVQRWLMIIKPHARAGGPWVGDLTQADIDAATFAFKETWPRTVRELTEGRVIFETEVVVSDSPVTAVNQQAAGMVGPEHIPEDAAKYVNPRDWDGVAVYNAFTEHAYWGTPYAAGVGWFSVQHCPDLSYGSDPVAGWIHESMHTMGWYYADERMGPVAPFCPDAPDHRDGTHCGGAYNYQQTSNGLNWWMGWYKDYLNGRVAGNLGLGSAAWRFGARREVARGLKPGSLIPEHLRQTKRDTGRYFKRNDEVTPAGMTGVNIDPVQ